MLLQNDCITLSYVFRFNYFVLNSDLKYMNHLNIYNVEYNNFSSIPIIQGFNFYFVIYDGVDQDAPYKTDAPWWWNVIAFGMPNRFTEIAFSAYRDRGSIYIRHKHDDDWYNWYRIEGIMIE